MKINIVVLLLIFSSYSLASSVEKKIIDKSLVIPVPEKMNPVCETNFNYWEFIRGGLPNNHVIITCMIDDKTVKNNFSTDADITLLALIQSGSIKSDINLKEFSDFKNGVLSYYDKYSVEEINVDGKKQFIDRSKPSIIINNKTELVLFESSSGKDALGEKITINWYRAILFVIGKPIELRVGSRSGGPYTKEKLIEFGNNWKKDFLRENNNLDI